MNFELDGTITKAMIVKMHGIKQEHLFEHFKSEGHSVFLGNVSITLLDKTDDKDSKRRENYWLRTLKTCYSIWT